ncbi:copper amine oxidase N-terminal domain-containing protein [Xylanibacillus composti]|uniref:Copper amine oxidase N-terminal domain-containing protein n=1 Tax=Xylanibacillus composti TaxID=1572762 RepID=A0A8J4H7S9_9BACL|nr:copper amine oxidase N-terminal domain-containing protein [Xylanibacillus composti]GIQ71341.1 copper amine oxidase N-terminal domain-containing protein [Xylanibacillus composti]
MLKKFVARLAAVGLALTFVFTPLQAKAEERDVFLHVNDTYILYTTPIAPYIDENNRFMLPLRAVSELLGATVDYHPDERRAQITFDGRSTELYIGSPNAIVNGESITYDTEPVLYKNSMIVPLRVLLDAFSLQAEWKGGTVAISDDRVMKTQRLNEIEDLDRNLQHVDRPTAFSVKRASVDMERVTEGANTTETIHLSVTVQNITGADIPEGKMDLVTTFLHPDRYTFEHYADTKERPPVKKDATYTLEKSKSTINSPLSYILLKARTIEP